ncbi:MAG: DUF6624 domain-containing protein [Bacteroidota bacterium]
MKNILGIFLLIVLTCGCGETTPVENSIEEKVKFDQSLADELKSMAEMDQIAAYMPQGKYQEMSLDEWNSFKDSVFTTHQKRLKQIFDQYGFVGFDLAGQDGSRNFWLMVQHSDHDPEFQTEVLEKMKIEVDKGNAIPSNYGLLVDRVNLNTGKKQVYGTQVRYNKTTGQAYPKPLRDSTTVNERRASIGLESIQEYLNSMTEMNFEMNKDNYLKKGVTEPQFYPVPE